MKEEEEEEEAEEEEEEAEAEEEEDEEKPPRIAPHKAMENGKQSGHAPCMTLDALNCFPQLLS